MVIDHAVLLLGEHKARLGFGLWHYLQSASALFSQTDNGFVGLPDGSAEFKRRFAEDLGVALGSLLMVQTLNVKWETVAQIPTNKKSLKKHAKTPDFVAFDHSGRKRVFECKGTTQPHDVDKHRLKAKQQLGDHQEANVSKFATVAYIPAASRLIPPFLFVSDPSVPLPSMTEAVAAGIHYLKVCEFAGLESLAEPLDTGLAQRLAIEDLIRQGESLKWQIERDFRSQWQQINGVVEQIAQRNDLVEFQGQRFAGEWRDAAEKGNKLRAFTGVSVEQLEKVCGELGTYPKAVAQFRAPRFQEQSALFSEPGDQKEHQSVFSLFSDGTLLLVEQVK